jgi:hypothetical protein
VAVPETADEQHLLPIAKAKAFIGDGHTPWCIELNALRVWGEGRGGTPEALHEVAIGIENVD